jgi:hypothetical protein
MLGAMARTLPLLAESRLIGICGYQDARLTREVDHELGPG